MDERLLHFIWQHSFFNFSQLKSEEGEHLEIIHPGFYNNNQGPDFLEAKIKVDDTLLVGSVEIHVKSSDWNTHKHSADNRYNNVILHVVWENDVHIQRNFSTLCLHNRTSKLLLSKYRDLMEIKSFVFCEDNLPVLSKLSWLQWKERLAVERLERRATEIITLFENNRQHWEETFWQLLTKNFGIKVNADVFFELSKLISINVLAKHKHQIHQLEAVLLGSAKLLPENTEDDYVQILKREYNVLQKKFSLKTVESAPLFLRMRPANFPTIRLAQLAMLVHRSSHLFSKIKEAENIEEIKNMLKITANDYWHYHYVPGDEGSDYFPKTLGKTMIENIIINTIVPVVFAYGHYHQQQMYKDKALDWLQKIKPENNTIIRQWKSLGIEYTNALESQALIELKNNYCDEKKCLDCTVGKQLLAQK